MRKFLVFLGILFLLVSCQIIEEYTFAEDGSGSYEMVFDMSELSAMGGGADSLGAKEPVDTTFVFADLLEEKKDSIAGLPLDEQEKLELLKPLQFKMIMNDATGEMVMRLRYDFQSLDDLENFGEALKQADIPELNELMATNPEMPGDSTSNNEEPPLFDMAQAFETKFNNKTFTRKIKKETREQQLKDKDTTLTADDPFVDMIRYKQVFKFPYRIAEVNNPKAKILSDFKGIEIEANLYELNNDPDFFNLKVKFEK